MNTKVEEALTHVGQAAEALEYAGANQRGVELVRAARETLAVHIAQQDATIARMREALAKCARRAKAHPEDDDADRMRNLYHVESIARAALNQGEVK